MMIDCPICGARNFEYEDFCDECDSDLDPDMHYLDDEGLNYLDDGDY